MQDPKDISLSPDSPLCPQGSVCFVGAGPGDPDLLTRKAERALRQARVILHDRLVTPGILALASPQARLINVGKSGFGPSTPQAEINARLIEEAGKGPGVIRLKGGDSALFSRLDEEIEACAKAGLGWTVIPGITAASAAVASIGQSLTTRGRNTAITLLSAHDIAGFAEQDWAALARPGAVAAIYMGKRAARFLSGRLLMHGADPDTPVSIAARVSRPDARTVATTLARLPADLDAARLNGPAVLILGLSPRAARTVQIPSQQLEYA